MQLVYNCCHLGLKSLLIIRTGPAKFPLSRLPVELLHVICSYLTPTQVASIRTVSSLIAAIGLEYIATTVILTLKEDSFDRLLEIAHHPVISKYVHSLHYEHDFLTKFDRAGWERQIKTREYMAVQDHFLDVPILRRIASERAWRASRRARSALQSCNMYGKRRLDQTFVTYQSHCAEQDHAWRSDFFIDKLTNSLQCLPNLRAIYMPKHGHYSNYQKEICQSLDGAFFDQLIIKSSSVDVTRSLLLAVDQAMRNSQNGNTRAAVLGDGAPSRISSRYSSDPVGDAPVGGNQVSAGQGGRALKSDCLGRLALAGSHQRVLRIEKFHSESLNWEFLLEDNEVFAAMKRSISPLTKLSICFLDDCYVKDDERCWRYPNDLAVQTECIRRGLLLDFVKSAPGLKELDVSFGLRFHDYYVHLMDFVGSFRWASLSTTHFGRIRISVECLEDFCSRHSSTLSNLSLGNIQMEDQSPPPEIDLWYLMFDRIREVTKLKKARVYGYLTGEGDSWFMHDRQDVHLASGTLIGRYLMHEGGNSNLEQFMNEERSSILEQGGAPSISDNASTSEGEYSSSESDA